MDRWRTFEAIHRQQDKLYIDPGTLDLLGGPMQPAALLSRLA